MSAQARDNGPQGPYARRGVLVFGVIIAALLLGVIQGMQVYASWALEGQAVPLRHAMETVVSWLILAALTPIPVLMTGRVPLSGRMRTYAAHMAAALVFTVAHLSLTAAYHSVGQGEFYGQFVFLLRFFFLPDLVTYSAIAAGFYTWRYYIAAERRQRRAIELENQLTSARLEAITAKLNPHFLFNTLNAIATLAGRPEPARVEEAIENLTRLLRASLDTRHQVVTLEEELALAETYIAIQRLRFGDRLEFEVDAHPAARRKYLPPLVLQPLLENAIEHGIGKLPGPGSIRISAPEQNGTLVVKVSDSGPGFTDSFGSGEGIGLRAVRARLEEQYEGSATMSLSRPKRRGADVVLSIPQ